MSNIKKIIVWVGNGVGKQVRPTYEWKPDSSRTLIYYPLTSNLVDQMWNWNTGTAHWTLSYDETTWIRFTWTSWNYVTGMSNWIANRNIFTMNVWVKCTSNSNTKILLWYNSNTPSAQCMYIAYESSNLRLVWFFWSSWSYAIVCSITTGTDWHNVCLVADWTSYKCYVDNVLGAENTSSNNMNNYSELQLWWWWYYWSSRSCDGYAKSYIVENYAWSEEDRTNYYNWSKEKLWI